MCLSVSVSVSVCVCLCVCLCTRVNYESSLAVPSCIDTLCFRLLQWEIAREEVKLDKLAARGEFADVHRATWRGSTVAAKVSYHDEGRELLLREVSFLKRLQHKHVVRFHGATTVGEPLLVVTELVRTPPLPQHRLIQQGRACVRACERACVLACLRGWKLAAFRCILLWSRLPNFVSTVSALSILTRMMLATQRNNQLEPGSLLDFLHGNGPRSLPLSQLLHVAEQIASGMAYLESVRIIHCCECRGSLFCWASADPIATRSTLRGRERESVCVCVCEFV